MVSALRALTWCERRLKAATAAHLVLALWVAAGVTAAWAAPRPGHSQASPQATAADAKPALNAQPAVTPDPAPGGPLQVGISVPAVPRVPPPPEDPRLAQVYAIIDGACVQCHQSGKLSQPYPAGGLANILDLDRIAREPQLVRRGEPDASRLYQVVLDRHRPVEIAADAAWPDAEGVLRLRTWIDELPPATRECPVIGDVDIARAIDETVRAAGETEGRDLRFISLVRFANACASASDLEAYRQGISRLLNSLSWGAQPINPAAVGPSNALIVFKLSDIGWIDEHWTALARAEPAGIALDLSGLLTAPGANSRPIRGDWLAWAATQPPFYAELLGLPQTLDETYRLLGIRSDNDPAALRNTRAAVKASAITRGPRVIERRSVENRTLWTAFDMFDLFKDREPLERPLGGVNGVPEPYQFRADGKRAMFALPNGFLAFMIATIDGRRSDQLGPRLDVEAAHVLGTSTAGLACLGCHSAGPKPFLDVVRPFVSSDKFSGPREIKEQAISIYAANSDWARILDDDGYRYRRATIQAGIDPDLTIDGLDPLAALARRYVIPVGFTGAAAEAGLSAPQFASALEAASLPDPSLALRLRQGLLTRAQINEVLALLKPLAASPKPGALAAMPPPPDQGLTLALWTDRPSYKTGDLVTIFAKASSACHLTLISVNGTGKGTVLFPNELEPDNLIPPNEPVRVPAPTSQYQFRFKDRGSETLIGTCQVVSETLPGIETDYERQRFTSIGSYENFVRASFALDVEHRPPAPPPTEKTRQPRLAAAKDAKSEAAKADGKGEQTARAAVRLVIE